MYWRLWKRTPYGREEARADLQSGSSCRIVRALHHLSRSPSLLFSCSDSMVNCFSHPDEYVRWYAAKVAASGQAIMAHQLVLGLQCDGSVGETTSCALRRLGRKALPALKSYLLSVDAEKQAVGVKRAIDLLIEIDEDAARTLYSLLNSRSRQQSAEGLIHLGEQTIPVLIEGYRSNERGEAELVAEILTKLGDPGFHALIELLLERPAQVKRRQLIRALWGKKGSFFDDSFFAGWKAVDTLAQELLELVQDDDAETTLVAAWLIREFMPLVSSERRADLENATSFLLLGEINDRLRKALERTLRGNNPEQLFLLAA